MLFSGMITSGINCKNLYSRHIVRLREIDELEDIFRLRYSDDCNGSVEKVEEIHRLAGASCVSVFRVCNVRVIEKNKMMRGNDSSPLAATLPEDRELEIYKRKCNSIKGP